MANLNKVFLIGRLVRDPELRYTPSGTAVADFRIAVNRSYTSSSGEQREETCYVDINVWGKRANLCCERLRKGSELFVEGRLRTDSWERDGQRRSKLRVVADNFQFLGGPRESRDRREQGKRDTEAELNVEDERVNDYPF
jgi:single-strand DNA-binding protein